MFTQENHNNLAAWQIDNRKKLLIENKDPNRVLLMILNMWNIYTKYFN